MFETILAIISGLVLIGFQVYFSAKNKGKMPYVFPAIFFGMSILWFGILMSFSQGAFNELILIFLVINIPTVIFLLTHFITKLVLKLKQ